MHGSIPCKFDFFHFVRFGLQYVYAFLIYQKKALACRLLTDLYLMLFCGCRMSFPDPEICFNRGSNMWASFLRVVQHVGPKWLHCFMLVLSLYDLICLQELRCNSALERLRKQLVTAVGVRKIPGLICFAFVVLGAISRLLRKRLASFRVRIL